MYPCVHESTFDKALARYRLLKDNLWNYAKGLGKLREIQRQRSTLAQLRLLVRGRKATNIKKMKKDAEKDEGEEEEGGS